MDEERKFQSQVQVVSSRRTHPIISSNVSPISRTIKQRTHFDGFEPPTPHFPKYHFPILPILNFLTELGPEGSNGFCRNLDNIFFEDFQNFFSFSPKRPFFKVTENPEKSSGTTKSSARNRTTFLVPILCLFVSIYAPQAALLRLVSSLFSFECSFTKLNMTAIGFVKIISWV